MIELIRIKPNNIINEGGSDRRVVYPSWKIKFIYVFIKLLGCFHSPFEASKDDAEDDEVDEGI